jgi:UDP-2-acetamido-3-amino-2,3-dideoxy-glucuronate N-acetyltransferase
MSGTTIRSLRRIAFAQHLDDGALTAFEVEPAGIPFQLVRVFTVAGVSANGRRGNHAHRACTQLLACLSGEVTIKVHDGETVVSKTLAPDGTALLIPPLLWNSVWFRDPATVLAVFCDEPYDPGDYLVDWDEYLEAKGSGSNPA